MPNRAADLPTTTMAKFEKALRDRSACSCGFAPMDNFLKSSLSDQIKDGMVTAWMATAKGQNTVLGFYTLGAMAVRAEFGPKKGHHLASCAHISSSERPHIWPRLPEVWMNIFATSSVPKSPLKIDFC